MAEETSAVSKWKPVKVKVNNWGVDFDYVLVSLIDQEQEIDIN